ncbi:MAG TPA: hypothetical protein VFJ06_04220 [Halococcus sp.]|nr:hypothetical protein [Halococcus sp.]
MSAEQRRITLTETADGQWMAREETVGITARGETKEAALAALDDADGDENDRGQETSEDVDPNAPLFAGDPFIDADLGDETIDDVLYGPIEADDKTETDGDT